MFRNYLKIAFRNLAKNKGYSAINIGGLAVGMAVAMLIGLWIYDELSFNKNHKGYDRIAQILQNEFFDEKTHTSRSLPYPFVHELKSNYSENFKNIVASTQPGEYILTAGEIKISKTGLFIESQAPELFTLEMKQGSWASLEDQQSILLSESLARSLFGDQDPLNKVIKINTDFDVKVSGVYHDFPQNSEFQNVEFLSNWDYFIARNPYMSAKKWDNHAILVYVELKPDVDLSKASAAIRDSEINVIRHMDGMQKEAATKPEMWLNPMANWHLYSQFENGKAASGPIQYVWLVGLIGFFVLLLACINFVNLTTARSEKRSKEVGIRKAVGSLRSQLIGQFFTESFLVVILSFAISILLVTISLSWFNGLAAKQMTIPWSNLNFWTFSLLFVFLTGLLSGSYPALYLTSFQPIKVLKGVTIHFGRFATLPRKVLVVTQFTVSISLVICTIIIYNQVQFAKKRPVGYSRNGLMMVEMKSADFYGKFSLIRNELKRTGAVVEVAESQSPTTGVWSSNDGFRWEGMPSGVLPTFATLTVSPEYAETVGWEFLSGRNLSKDFTSDTAGFVINETAAKLLNFKGDSKAVAALGQTVNWKSQWMTDNIDKPFKVLGVVKDMVMNSPFEPVAPTVFFLFGSPNWINIRLNPNLGSSDAVSKIETVFKKLIPTAPFAYKFADEEYDAKFRAEERIGKLVAFFACLAILISCLGLFGLASFVAEQRTKEIGIRKVLGATVVSLWQMLSRDFVVLVVFACLMATPIAWYAMDIWLAKYNYRTEISLWIFAASGLGAMSIAILTVSYQAIRAALLNPVKSLKME